MSILDSHPEIQVIPFETSLLRSRPAEKRIVRNIRLNRKVVKFQILMMLFSSKVKPSAKRWAEKTPLNIMNVEEIDKMYKGKVRFINIIRDGRATVSSYHRELGYMVNPRLWYKCTTEGLRFNDKENFLTLKYEDLLRDKETSFEIISKFLHLKEPFPTNWFDKTNIKGNVKKMLSKNIEGSTVESDIVKDKKNTWQESESPHLKDFIDDPKCMELNREMGYH
ncbi:sulfotransferase [Fulvivirga maritima]|nr:sulfotransferase [Fulvivirga maritima]UII24837.1 sulfotransferase [Fulvivirga maritima]